MNATSATSVALNRSPCRDSYDGMQITQDILPTESRSVKKALPLVDRTVDTFDTFSLVASSSVLIFLHSTTSLDFGSGPTLAVHLPVS